MNKNMKLFLLLFRTFVNLKKKKKEFRQGKQIFPRNPQEKENDQDSSQRFTPVKKSATR